MKILRLTIKPSTAFGSSLLGETLFGQLCWTIRNLQGEENLIKLLDGYLQGHPFAVVSDGFPAGMMPLPHLPGSEWPKSNEDLKKLKKLSWVSVDDMKKSPVKRWRDLAAALKAKEDKVNEKDNKNKKKAFEGLQSHNKIDRMTSTTRAEDFAPFNMPLTHFGKDYQFDIYVLFDPERISEDLILDAFIVMGIYGFGRDATTGLGKFELTGYKDETKEWLTAGETFMALSGVCLSGLKFKAPSYYKVRTHFGRHGGLLAQGPNPFKAPVVTTVAGAVFTPETKPTEYFIGSGIGNISKSEPSAVHQGYAIVVGLDKLKIGGNA